MQIVIEISEDDYKEVKDDTYSGTSLENRVFSAIANGTPLPKGHGRLIILSEDALKREQTSFRFSCQDWISEVGISNATVAIIEADKERTDKE